MITLSNVAKAYGAQVLFENVNVQFDPGKRYGIVGPNGAGKSTLLRAITGEEYLDAGEVHMSGKIKLGTLNQDHFAFEDQTIVNVVMQGNEKLAGAVEEKDHLLEQPDPSADRLCELEMIIADEDGYVAEARIAEMLVGLGIPESKHYQKMSVLSGGYKLRVLLAQCLFSNPDALLLDEPTNHLDILSIKWLEDYLRQFRGAVLLVSHDRLFLNNVCTHICDLDYQTLTAFTGNYDQFLVAREEADAFRAAEAAKAEKRIGELQDFVTKYKAKATKARQAQSKARMIQRMEKNLEDPVYSSRIAPRIKFQAIRPPGKQVLEVENLQKSYGSHKVLEGISFNIYRGDKVGILGPNGVGKSTLLKILMQELEPDSGSFEWGHETYPQYFSQDHHEALDTSSTPYEWLYQFAPGESIGTIRGTLGNMLFSGDDVEKSNAALSGGEAARLVIAKLILKKGNVLVMDEPTNHLDMESIEALVEALKAFDGTVILVSHNRYVVDKVATKVLELREGRADMFDGTYAEFLDKYGVDHLSFHAAQEAAAPKEKKEPKKDPVKAKQQLDRETKKAMKAEMQTAKDRLEAAEGKIESLEEYLEAITDLFSDPTYFSKTKPEEVTRQNQRKKELESQLEAVMAEWEAAGKEIETIQTKYGQ